MSGGRFEEAEGLPLSAIGELKNYKDLIDDVAARLYKREHPVKESSQWVFSRYRHPPYRNKAWLCSGGNDKISA